MKKFFLIFITMMLSSLAYAKPALVMTENAKVFFKNRNQASLKRNAYIVEIDEMSYKTLDDLKTKMSNANDVKLTRLNVLKVKNEKLKMDLSEVESNRAICAREMLKMLLPNDYAAQFRLISIDKEHSFAVSQGAKIRGYTFNFKRVFNGRVVRNKNNFLRIRTDGDGFLRDARIALQDLKNTSESILIDETDAENEATLDSLLTEDFDSVNTRNKRGMEKTVRMEKVEVGSVAEAYCEVAEGDNKKLFPCLSYASKIFLENNEEIGSIIDVPHTRKSWSDYYAKKDSVQFSRYRH
ncbi:MAG: hypothetical protein IKS96_09180 [Fibrobacter sp.]|nr:hypothetical protein [Fibrobacter sp.]